MKKFALILLLCVLPVWPLASQEAETDSLSVVLDEEAVDELLYSPAEWQDSLTVADIPVRENLYMYPYSIWRRCPNWKRLWQNTAVLFAAGFATLGVLELLPENTTAWNKSETRNVPFLKRWWKHAKAGPVWDGDLPVFNYILHPYAGAAYYMGARSQGLNVLGSALYCTFISTVFWEYGIECFNEVPSIQDLVITPIGGMVLGEAFYIAKRHIVENDYRLLGSKVLGNIVVVMIDPVNEVLGFIFGNSARDWAKYCREHRGVQVSSYLGPAPGMRFGLSVSATF